MSSSQCENLSNGIGEDRQIQPFPSGTSTRSGVSDSRSRLSGLRGFAHSLIPIKSAIVTRNFSPMRLFQINTILQDDASAQSLMNRAASPGKNRARAGPKSKIVRHWLLPGDSAVHGMCAATGEIPSSITDPIRSRAAQPVANSQLLALETCLSQKRHPAFRRLVPRTSLSSGCTTQKCEKEHGLLARSKSSRTEFPRTCAFFR